MDRGKPRGTLAVKRKFDPGDWRYRKRHLPPRARTRTVPEGYWYQGTTPFEYTTIKGSKVTVQPGERLSNRQYQNLRYQSVGWQSKSQYERVRYLASLERPGKGARKYKMPHEAGLYDYFSDIASDEHAISVKLLRRIDSEYSSLFAAALNDGFKDKSPDGPFAQLLVYVGLRTNRDDWQVGETNIQASGRMAP